MTASKTERLYHVDSLRVAPFVKFIIATIVAALLSIGIAYLAKRLPGLRRIL